MSVPNQKSIELQKQDKAIGKSYISVRSQEAEKLAVKILTPAALKMWLAITANVNGYTFDLSSTAMANDWGITISSYNRAVKELQEKGYMVAKEGKKNSFKFYDFPQEQTIEIEVIKVAAAAQN